MSPIRLLLTIDDSTRDVLTILKHVATHAPISPQRLAWLLLRVGLNHVIRNAEATWKVNRLDQWTPERCVKLVNWLERRTKTQPFIKLTDHSADTTEAR